MGIRVVKYYLISRRILIMVILGPQGGWNGGRGVIPHPRKSVAEEGRDEPDHSGYWLDDLGESGSHLAVGHATPTREFRPDAPDADTEEASVDELVEA
ncbi:MAG: hypothetical protein PHN33_02385 [Candidatus Peribacteraceae bacterium]|nr:hypothetical protein [Candidatus Peribacteraceae bacterium]